MKRAFFLTWIAAGVLLLPPSLTAQQPLSATEISYRHARRVLDAGIAALGGLPALEAANNFSLKMTGTSYQLFAGKDPELPFDGWQVERTGFVDTQHHRLVMEEKLQFGKHSWWTRTIVKDGSELFVNLDQKTFAVIPNPSWSDYRNWFELLPHFLVSEALQRAASLRWVGIDQVQGRRQDVISYATATGRTVTLYFDRQTKLLTRHDYLYTRNSVGDTIRRFVFKGYRDIGQTKVPSTRISYNAGHFASEQKYLDVQFNNSPGEDAFSLPAGLTRIDVVEPRTEVEKLAKDVYLLHLPDGFNTFFVAFNDYVLVAEAPETDIRSGLSEQAVEIIHRTVPGRPIRYLVLTHHHGDHAGGARAYIAEGATVVTTPGNKAFVERLAAAPFRMSVDSLARNPQPLVIETIQNKKRVFRDDNHVVEVHDIGPIEHAREMVILYLPNEKILFQSDLLNPIAGGGPPIPIDAIFHGIFPGDTIALRKSIAELGLRVETIAGSHGRVATIRDLTEAVQRAALK
jgi:glyoxylase-like metal-dependent hydrolase (beta-lactamase superfamily II)